MDPPPSQHTHITTGHGAIRRLTTQRKETVMPYYTTDPKERDEFIASLRTLADYLATRPAVPVPKHGITVLLHANSADDDGRCQVRQIARLLGVNVTDETATGGHYSAVRCFGVIGYEVVAITEAYSALVDAEASYRGCVIPDPVTSNS
jgi:hypothetical protein